MFHERYCSEGHQGIEKWSVTLIDQVEDLDSLTKWPNGLNVREVYEIYQSQKKKKKKKKKLFWKELRCGIYIPIRTFFKSDNAITELIC